MSVINKQNKIKKENHYEDSPNVVVKKSFTKNKENKIKIIDKLSDVLENDIETKLTKNIRKSFQQEQIPHNFEKKLKNKEEKNMNHGFAFSIVDPKEEKKIAARFKN